jgi:hypothetical protein
VRIFFTGIKDFLRAIHPLFSLALGSSTTTLIFTGQIHCDNVVSSAL